MKKLFINWKFSISVFIVVVILNIIFLCQPVVGSYKGITKDSGSYYSETYDTNLSFNNGVATVTYTRNLNNEKTTAYNVGCYQRIDNQIIIITFLTNPNESDLDMRKRVFTRESVFTLSSGYNKYTSTISVFLQLGFVTLELVFLIRFVLQLKNGRLINKDKGDAE